ncbi:carboxylesterase/lipase family protein [Pandoraea sp. PE-S2R-1]|uniref:carboxylesterase/lipase family protein n=1 Tax=Pandoraea sp. PE-S2R-1 TaxID=1986994 RepID=UPI000B3FA2C6|nr:carboxylesterase family protein [Pandoraea sp. PE-S2R-1]
MTQEEICLAECASGRLAGRQTDGVMRFLGVPYAAPPVGPLRFASPRPAVPWTGVRDAGAHGAAPLQTVAGIVSWIYPQLPWVGEDCLNVNIWAPVRTGDAGERLPVVLWLYGGAFGAGANSLPLSDGAVLAREGNLIVVAPNYRVGVLGFAGHPDWHDASTGAQANWGLQDQAFALEWVHANIAAFGGDPDRITVMGQSAGAISAILLAQHPASTARFHQLALFSVPYIAPPDVAEPEDLAACVEDLAAHFATSVAGLRDIPAMSLTAGTQAFFSDYRCKTRTGRFRRWPTRDATSAPAWPGTRSLGAKPMLIGNTRTESSFSLDLYDTLQARSLTAPLPTDVPGVRAAVERLLDLRFADPACRPEAQALIAHFAELDDTVRGPGDQWLALHSDAAYRHPTWRVAQRATIKGSAVYYYDFGMPLAAPARGTPHNADLPFWFGSYDTDFYRAKFGAGVWHARLSETMRALLARFVHTGCPAGGETTDWPAMSAHGVPDVMRLGHVADMNDGAVASVGTMPDFARLKAFDPLYFPEPARLFSFSS